MTDVTCPLCEASFPIEDMVIKSDAWLIREFDPATGKFTPVSVATFDHTVLQCALCGEEFEDREVEDAVEWGSAYSVEVL